MKHLRRGVAGAASHMRHDWRPFQNIWAIYADHRALTAAGLTCHYHRGRRRAATAQYRTQTRCLRNAPATGLMRDGPSWFGLYIRIGLRASMCLRRRVRASPARAPPKSASDAGSGTGWVTYRTSSTPTMSLFTLMVIPAIVLPAWVIQTNEGHQSKPWLGISTTWNVQSL